MPVVTFSINSGCPIEKFSFSRMKENPGLYKCCNDEYKQYYYYCARNRHGKYKVTVFNLATNYFGPLPDVTYNYSYEYEYFLLTNDTLNFTIKN